MQINPKKNINLNQNQKPSQKELQTLDDLVTALSEEERTTINHIIRSININPKDIEKYTSWSEDCYTRNCIINNEKFELILICWCKGHKTPIHDHGGQECWVKVIEGELEEVIYKKNENDELIAIRSSKSKANQVTYMKDFMGFHSLENISPNRSITLHLYAKPIRKCNIFNEDLKKFVSKEMNYDTVANYIKK